MRARQKERLRLTCGTGGNKSLVWKSPRWFRTPAAARPRPYERRRGAYQVARSCVRCQFPKQGGGPRLSMEDAMAEAGNAFPVGEPHESDAATPEQARKLIRGLRRPPHFPRTLPP